MSEDRAQDLMAALEESVRRAREARVTDETCPDCGYWSGGLVCRALCDGNEASS